MTASSRLARPLTFFVVAYALSWGIWIPLVLSHFGVGPFLVAESTSSLVRLLGVLMPAVTALLLTARTLGRRGVLSLLGRLADWRVGWRWWAAAMLVHPLLLLAAALIHNALGGSPPVAAAPALSADVLIVSVVMLTIATLGEEIGWRGVALPALQERTGAMAASLILGIAWATWHVPFWLLLDTLALYGTGYLLMNYFFVLAGTFYITWFFNHSRGSLLLPVAFHLSFNVVNVALLPVTSSPAAFLVLICLDWLIALAILPHLTPKRAPLSQPEPVK